MGGYPNHSIRTAFVENVMVTGMVILWHGAVVDIPAGFALCDGNNGTPNMLNVFVRGAGDTYAPDSTGGSNSHRHIFTGDGHHHTHGAGPDIASGDGFSDTDQDSPAIGQTDYALGVPQYRALCFIMKT